MIEMFDTIMGNSFDGQSIIENDRDKQQIQNQNRNIQIRPVKKGISKIF